MVLVLDSKTVLKKREQPDVSDSTVRILNFLLATGHCCLNDDLHLEFELRRLLLNEKILTRSCYFYDFYKSHSLFAMEKLRAQRTGSFLIRYSQHPKCLYTLSFSNIHSGGFNGLLHCRIQYRKGWFSLFRILNKRHAFKTVTDLIEHYQLSPPWISEMNGPLEFKRRLLCSPPSLKHLCLKSIASILKNSPRESSISDVKHLGLPEDLEVEVGENAFPLESVKISMITDARKGLSSTITSWPKHS